jgi:hypothetical protein
MYSVGKASDRGIENPLVGCISVIHMLQQGSSPISHVPKNTLFVANAKEKIPEFVLNVLFPRLQLVFLGVKILLKKLTQMLSGQLQIALIVLEYSGLIVLFKVECKSISVHEGSTALIQNINGLL